MSSVYSEAPRPGELWPAMVSEDPLRSGGPLAAEMTCPLSPDTLLTGRGLRRWRGWGGREPLGEGGRDLLMEVVALTPCAPITLSSSEAEGVSVGGGVSGSVKMPVTRPTRVAAPFPTASYLILTRAQVDAVLLNSTQKLRLGETEHLL